MEDNFNDFSLVEESHFKYGTIKSYRDLIVWQKSMELVKEIYVLTNEMPDSEKFGLTSQIRRASVSIPSNIAEGWGRNSKGSYLNHLKIANGSCCETETQLQLIENLRFLEITKIENTKKLLDECGKMLRSMILKLESQNN